MGSTVSGSSSHTVCGPVDHLATGLCDRHKTKQEHTWMGCGCPTPTNIAQLGRCCLRIFCRIIINFSSIQNGDISSSIAPRILVELMRLPLSTIAACELSPV